MPTNKTHTLFWGRHNEENSLLPNFSSYSCIEQGSSAHSSPIPPQPEVQTVATADDWSPWADLQIGKQRQTDCLIGEVSARRQT